MSCGERERKGTLTYHLTGGQFHHQFNLQFANFQNLIPPKILHNYLLVYKEYLPHLTILYQLICLSHLSSTRHVIIKKTIYRNLRNLQELCVYITFLRRKIGKLNYGILDFVLPKLSILSDVSSPGIRPTNNRAIE